jgi:type II secretory ATPase GspE/PulE/Tfp pilus assembly ATPase PilB-like protein
VYGIMSQRLLRQLGDDGQYQGRLPVAEMAVMDDTLRTAILNQADLPSLCRSIAQQPHHQTMQQIAAQMITAGLTDEAEVTRILGASS